MAGENDPMIVSYTIIKYHLSPLQTRQGMEKHKVGLMHDRQTSRDGFSGEFDAQVLQLIILYG